MASNETPSLTSSDSEAAEVSIVGVPSTVKAPAGSTDLYAFRASKEGRELATWAKEQFSKCKTQQGRKRSSWIDNLSMTLGHQWLSKATGAGSDIINKVNPGVAQNVRDRRTVNRIRAFVRTEQSKFLSTVPTINVVPSTAEEEDVRSAYAGEQVVESYVSKRKLRREFSKAVWWMINTGTGILKQWWDPTIVDPTSGEYGDIVYRSVSPFNLFVPDMREPEIDDQPYIIHAQVKTLEWVKQFYGQEIQGEKVTPSQISTNGLLDDQYFNLAQTPKSDLDSVIIMEMWVKPGTHSTLPKGGLLVFVEDTMVGAFTEGMPYDHNEYPFSKVEHLSNATFWADSPVTDLKELQREFNEVRTAIGISARRMGQPQLISQKGAIIPGRLTNQAGLVIEYRPGTPPPQPLQLQPIPQYVVGQLEQILLDFEDISGQHQISKAQAPTGITAGTALSFLKETDDNYLTPQYQSVEDFYERIARQTLGLFKQFVDHERKIKVIGADSSYDTALLSGADVAGGSDVRVEPGSAVGESQAAKRASVMDMFSVGILQDPNQALRLLEVGGAQKVLDTVSVAEKKAQRENMKMKDLASPEGEQAMQEQTMQQMQEMIPQMMESMNADPEFLAQNGGQPATMESIVQDPEIMQFVDQQMPPFIPADDFDMHMIHIEVHNRYRMGQEYETLPDSVKKQFDKHVQQHQMLAQQQQMQQMMMGGMPPGPGGPEEGQPGAGGPEDQQPEPGGPPMGQPGQEPIAI